QRSQIIAANKMDMPHADEQLQSFQKKIDVPIYPISAITQSGIDALLYAIVDLLAQIPSTSLGEERETETVIYRHQEKQKPFYVTRADDGAFVLYGAQIERLFKMTDFSQNEATQ